MRRTTFSLSALVARMTDVCHTHALMKPRNSIQTRYVGPSPLSFMSGLKPASPLSSDTADTRSLQPKCCMSSIDVTTSPMDITTY